MRRYFSNQLRATKAKFAVFLLQQSAKKPKTLFSRACTCLIEWLGKKQSFAEQDDFAMDVEFDVNQLDDYQKGKGTGKESEN